MQHLKIGRFVLDWSNFISLAYYIEDVPQWIIYAQVGWVTKKTMVSDQHMEDLMNLVGK